MKQDRSNLAEPIRLFINDYIPTVREQLVKEYSSNGATYERTYGLKQVTLRDIVYTLHRIRPTPAIHIGAGAAEVAHVPVEMDGFSA